MARKRNEQEYDFSRASHAAYDRSGNYIPANSANQGNRSKPRHGGKQKGKGWSVLFYISLTVAIAALVFLGVVVFQYAKGRLANNHIADSAGVAKDTQVVNLSDLKVDWKALRAINPDVVAWVYMPGTPINYPVVQTNNNDTYLYTDFEGKTSWGVSFGTIFLDYRNDSSFVDQNNFIYGHHMNDGSMFAFINDLLDSRKFNDNRTMYLMTPAGNYRLTSYSVLHVSAYERIVKTQFSSDADWLQYVQSNIDRSDVTPSTEIPKAENMGRTFMFSTCDNDLATDGRVILCCYIAETTVPGVLCGTVGTAVSDKNDSADAAEE